MTLSGSVRKLAQNELSDIDVLTLGLVPQGANKREFFLRKEAAMPEDELKLESQDKEPTWLGKLIKALKPVAVSDAAGNAIAKAVEDLKLVKDELPEDARVAYETLRPFAKACAAPPEDEEKLKKAAKPAEGYGYPDPGKAPKDEEKCPKCGKPMKDCVCEKKAKTAKEDEPVTKTDTAPLPVAPEVTEKLALLEKMIKDQNDLIEKQRVDLEKAQAETQRQVFITKAVSLGLPAPASEVADFMQAVASKLPEKAAWFEATLSAVAKQIADAGFYNEVGSSFVPAEQADLVAKMDSSVSKGAKPEDALLSIPADVQQAYLAQRQRMTTGK